MAVASALESWVRQYDRCTYVHTELVRHKGKIVSFAMTNDRRIQYAVLDLEGGNEQQEDDPSSTLDVAGWPDQPSELLFPREIATVGFGVVDPLSIPVHKKAHEGRREPQPDGTVLPARQSEEAARFDYFLSTTARLSSDAPFQALSDGVYVYVFRQSLTVDSTDGASDMVYVDADGTASVHREENGAAGHAVVRTVDNPEGWLDGTAPTPLVDGTLLADRFVLAGNELTPKREVRYQRSRSKARPAGATDSLGAADLDGESFYEPTQALRLVGRIEQGRFAVLLLPTQIAEVERWQIFTQNPQTRSIDSFNIARSRDGLFNTMGSTAYACEKHPTVYSPLAGRCPEPGEGDRNTCGLEFVPRTVVSGHAESALELSSGGNVTFDQPVTIGSDFTIEAWIWPSALKARHVLLNGEGPTGLTLWIGKGGKAGLACGGKKLGAVTGLGLKSNAWNHLSVTCDGIVASFRNAVVEAENVVAEEAPQNTPLKPAPTIQIGSVGAAKRGFEGVIDEIRLWDIARSDTALRRDRRRRLTGLEPGLVGYWRFDEASGAIAFDATTNGHNGILSEQADWITSDAPVGEHPGSSRDSFCLDGRRPVSGLAALFYSRQLPMTTGYAREEKPVKRESRVLVAMATATGDTDDKPCVAVLDIAITASGRLAQLPDVIRLQSVGKSSDLAMPLVNIDPAGFSTSGGLLEFAWTTDTPYLLDSATGNVVLYFRGIDGQFFAAYYDTRSHPSSRTLVTADGRDAVRLLSRVSEREADSITVSLDSGTLEIAMPAAIAASPERWPSVPSNATELADIINGRASANGNEADAGARNAGSRLVWAEPVSDEDFAAVDPERRPARPCVWRAAMPGKAFQLTIGSGLSNDGRAGDAQPEDDLTIEAWVRPGAVGKGEPGQTEIALVDQASGTRSYKLGLDVRDKAAPARRFDGLSFVQVETKDALQIAGQITLEAWIRPTRVGQLQYIVGRSGLEGETFLRISGDGYYEAGSWDADHRWDAKNEQGKPRYTLKARVQVPEGDYDQWVHLVAVYDGSTWTIYHNGKSAASQETPLGAVITTGPFRFGACGKALGGFQGYIDEVRIWNRPRAQDDIERYMYQGLGGDEEGLVGYWPLRDGTLRDRTETRADGQLLGSQTPLSFNGKSYIEIPGVELGGAESMTVEAWVRPENGGMILTSGRDCPDRGNLFYLSIDPTNCDVGRHLKRRDPVFGDKAVKDKWYYSRAKGNFRAREWVHIAGVYDGEARKWIVYVDGNKKSEKSDSYTPPSKRSWYIGGWPKAGTFSGSIADVRIWNVARSEAEIKGDRLGRPVATEANLVGYWLLDGIVAGKVIDLTPNRAHGTPVNLTGAGPESAPVLGYGAFARVGDHRVRINDSIPDGHWTHLAAVYRQAFGLRLGNDRRVDCGNNQALNLCSDLTIEMDLMVDSLEEEGEILRKASERGNKGPYKLTVRPGADSDKSAGQLVFSFDTDAGPNEFVSEHLVESGVPCHVAMTRHRCNKMVGAKTVFWDEVRLSIDGDESKLKTEERGIQTTISGNSAPLIIGGDDPTSGDTFVVSDLRIWSEAVDANSIGRQLTGDEQGLVAWLPMEERIGRTVADRKHVADGRIRGGDAWVPDPDDGNSGLLMYVDGLPALCCDDDSVADVTDAADGQFGIGPNTVDGADAHLDEVRIWRSCRTMERIQDNMFRRLTDTEDSELIACYPFDDANGEGVRDVSMAGLDLRPGDDSAPTAVPSTAPIGDDTPQVRSALAPDSTTRFSGSIGTPAAAQEYGDLQYDDAGNPFGVLKRCYTYTLDDAWVLITGFKVGDLRTEWIGQIQFAPQLMGYIEGAPPVPSENLIQRAVPGIGDIDDYNEASIVVFRQADEVNRTIASHRETANELHTDLLAGVYLGTELKAGFGVLTEAMKTDNKVGIRNTFDVSWSSLNDATADARRTTTRSTSLELRGYFGESADERGDRRFLADNVGLALVQSETADLFALRLLGNDAAVGFQMRPNPDIPKDWNLIHFPISRHYTKQGTLDGRVGGRLDEDSPNVTAGAAASYYRPREAYTLKNRIEQELRAAALDYERLGIQASRDQKKDLPSLAKRNLCNTYVWTADGGLFAETDQALEAISEVTGGTYDFHVAAGVHAETQFRAGGVGWMFELDALYGRHLVQTTTKTEESSRSFGVEVQVDKVERDIYERESDPDSGVVRTKLVDGKPVRAAGRVDAYRFMTFYLDADSKSHDEFYGRVVDPIWLEGDSPAAAALREARQEEKSPPCWRIMHRVTYVSRVPGELDEPAEPQAAAEPALDLESSYELIKQLEPYVAWDGDDPGKFPTLVKEAVTAHLPTCAGQTEAITDYMRRYLSEIGASPSERGD